MKNKKSQLEHNNQASKLGQLTKLQSYPGPLDSPALSEELHSNEEFEKTSIALRLRGTKASELKHEILVQGHGTYLN
jgi:hypothetical protein